MSELRRVLIGLRVFIFLGAAAMLAASLAGVVESEPWRVGLYGFLFGSSGERLLGDGS